MSEGKRLRALRIKLRLSQKELADLIGVQSWIPAWESGRSATPPFVWAALARLENEKKPTKVSVER